MSDIEILQQFSRRAKMFCMNKQVAYALIDGELRRLQELRTQTSPP